MIKKIIRERIKDEKRRKQLYTCVCINYWRVAIRTQFVGDLTFMWRPLNNYSSDGKLSWVHLFYLATSGELIFVKYVPSWDGLACESEIVMKSPHKATERKALFMCKRSLIRNPIQHNFKFDTVSNMRALVLQLLRKNWLIWLYILYPMWRNSLTCIILTIPHW